MAPPEEGVRLGLGPGDVCGQGASQELHVFIHAFTENAVGGARA